MPNPNFPNNPGYNIYYGARYVPVFSSQPGSVWTNTIKYDPLTIVLWQGNSYTSKTFVPIGVDITDTTYWAQTGNYNAQIEQLRVLYEELNNDIIEINKQISQVFENLNYLINADLKAGTMILLTGYYNSGDMPPMIYHIGTTGEPDGGSIIELNNGLYAQSIHTGGWAPENFGINNSLSEAESIDRWNKYTFYVNNGSPRNYFVLYGRTYNIYKPINIYKNVIGLVGMTSYTPTLKAMTSLDVVSTSPQTYNNVYLNYSAVLCICCPNLSAEQGFLRLENFCIDTNQNAQIGLFIAYGTHITANNLYINGGSLASMYIQNNWMCTYRNISVRPSGLFGFLMGNNPNVEYSTSNTTTSFINCWVAKHPISEVGLSSGWFIQGANSVSLISCGCDGNNDRNAYTFSIARPH